MIKAVGFKEEMYER